jgi:hypothetical protein
MGNTRSLRQAIEVADGTLAIRALSTQERTQIKGALSTPNTIAFAIPRTGVQMIDLTSPLPAISEPVVIDGDTQPGSSPNTDPVGKTTEHSAARRDRRRGRRLSSLRRARPGRRR